MYDVKFEKTVSKAIELGDIEKVKELLNNDNEKINMSIPRGNWLNIAVGYQQLEIVEYLLEIGIDRNLVSRTGNSLVNAARTGNVEMAEFLLNKGVELTCTLNALNPIIPAVQSDRLDMVIYLLEKEKALLSEKEYNELVNIIIENAEIFSAKNILNYFGVGKKVKKNKMTKTEKNKIVQLIEKNMKECFIAIQKECEDEKIYILSTECDEDMSAIYVYMNTEENLQRQLDNADEEMKDEIYYYKYCEDEWYVFEDSPKYFKDVSDYVKKKELTNDDKSVWYELFVESLLELQKEKFFEQQYNKNKILLTINAHDTFSEEAAIDYFRKLNAGENCSEYMKNIEQFY